MRFRRIVYAITNAGAGMGDVALVALMLVTVLGVVLRAMRVSTLGFFETVCVLGMIVFVAGWGYAQQQRAHVRVFILVSRLPALAQRVIDAFVQVLSVGTCSIMVWYSVGFAYKLWHDGQVVSIIYPVPLFIIMSIIAFFIFLLDLVLVIHMYDSFTKGIRRK